MSWVTVIWSAASGACLMLAMVHLLLWCRDWRSWANFCFPIMVLGVIALGICELLMLRADSPERFGEAGRWAHLSFGLCVAGGLGFVHFYFGTGRKGLLGAALVLRFLALVANFTTGANLHFESIHSLQQISFLGEPVSIVGEWEANPWVRLGQLASLVQVIYIVDASVRLWRRGSSESRRRSLCVGGSLVFFIFVAVGHAGLAAAGVTHGPLLVSFPFFGMVLAISYELSREVQRAARLARDLDKTEGRLRQAAEAGGLAFWEWDVRADRIWIPEEGRLLFGADPTETLDFQRFLELVHPEDRSAVTAAVERALAGPSPFSADYRIVLRDGTIRWIAATGRVDRDSKGKAALLRGVSADMTERKNAEDRFRIVIESAPDAIIMSDHSGRIVLVNARAEAVFGYSRPELHELTIESLIPERFRNSHRHHRGVYHGEPFARTMGVGRELFARRKDGTELPVEIGLNPIETAEGMFILASIVDISVRKQAALEAAEQRLELAHLSRVSVLGELAGSLAHELNQPLAAMLSNSQVGLRSLKVDVPDLVEMEAILDDIVADAKRAGGIVHGIRALFKKDAPIELLPVDLNGVVKDILNLLHSEIVVQKVRVEFAVAGFPLPVLAGRIEIQQILINLLLNSIDALKTHCDHSQSGSEALVRISTSREANFAIVRVSDNGPGIPDELAARLFEPFVSTKQGGLGLGLSISRRIAERFGGTLEAENGCEQPGAVFRLTLPLRQVEDGACQ